MSFKVRNTIILFAIALTISCISGAFVFYHYPRKIEEMEIQIKESSHKLSLIPEREQYLTEIQQIIKSKKENLAKLDKEIDSEITMAQAFRYLDRIQDRFGQLRTFALNFTKEVSAGGYGYKVFSLDGEGTFEAVFGLIWTLENGPKIFSIDALNLRGLEIASNREEYQQRVMVPFDLKIRAMYADIPDLPVQNRSLEDVKVPHGENFFWPLIERNLPPNERGLLETERAELRAILPDQAVIADPSGEIHVLREGDEVYLGYLTKIKTEKNWVEFTLNKGGIVEVYILKLSFTPDEQGNQYEKQ